VFFFRKTIRLAAIKKKKKKPAEKKKRPAKKANFPKILIKGIRVIRSCHVQQWELALDTGDYTHNAFLYPLNYASYFHQHLQVNFNDENYLFVRIRNKVWRMLYAFFFR
jgi:hypothetical protein